MKPEKFNITDANGRVIYKNLVRSTQLCGYDWNDNAGHVTDSTIRFEGWKVVLSEPSRGNNSFTADGWRTMSPETQAAIGAMVKCVLNRPNQSA